MPRNMFKAYTVEDIQKEVKWYERRLKHSDMALNTVLSYTHTLSDYLFMYKGIVSADNLIAYKNHSMGLYTSSTVNSRINGLNRYFREKDVNYHLKSVKIQRKTYADNVISFEDYIYLKKRLKRDKDWENYYLIWGLGCTGCRVSEINKMKVEHVKTGRMVIYGKRRERVVYIPKKFRNECSDWLRQIGKDEGFLFENTSLDCPLDTHKIEQRIKKMALKYNIDNEVMYPHSFRHMYAKACIKNGMDIADLSDLLGHASLETTRLYVRKSLNEQSEMVNQIVNW